MPAVPMEQIEPVLQRIDAFCRELGKGWGDRMLKGCLRELKVHFLQRAIPGAYCTDLDFILVRFEGNNRHIPVALIEIKKNGRPLDEWQAHVYRHIADGLHLPFYLLEATEERAFHIINMGNGSRIGPLSLKRLGEWMRCIIYETEFVEIEYPAEEEESIPDDEWNRLVGELI